MHGCGAERRPGAAAKLLNSIALMSLSLLIAGPHAGAGREGRGRRMALSLALQVHADATMVAEDRTEGSIS